MAEARGGFHRDLFATLSIRDVLIVASLARKTFRGFGDILPTSVAVPGGRAFFTSSFEMLNACFREVIAMN